MNTETGEFELVVRCIENRNSSLPWKPAFDRISIRCTGEWSIYDLKVELENCVGLQVTEQRLIYQCRVMVNTHTIRFYGCQPGSTLFLLRTNAKTTQPSVSPTNTIETGPLFNNPFMQHMLDNPQILERLVESNPQLRDLRERIPEVGSMLNDPETLRTSLEAMRNPSVMREMMRNTDRALSHINSTPGGHDALRRIYRSMYEPLMDTAAGSEETNNRNSNPREYDLQTNQPPSCTPIPNPWNNNPTSISQTGQNTTPGNISFGGSTFNPLIFNIGRISGAQNPTNIDVNQYTINSTNRNPTYDHQKRALLHMGFPDEAQIIRILEQCNGDINDALDRLLGSDNAP